MNKMKIFKFSLMILLLATISCDDYLDKFPSNAPSSANVLSNKEELQLAINSAYDHLDYKYVWYGDYEYSSVLVLDAFSDIGWNRSDGGIQKIAEGEMTSDIGILNTYWKYYYQGIAKVNNILDNIDRAVENTAPEEINRFKGEALFIRAYIYYQLAALWGDVVLHTTTPDSEGTSDFPVTSQSAVLDQVVADIDQAISLLPTNESSKNVANKYAALALKARVSLYLKDYTTAASAAKEVIDNGGYSLYPNFREMFTSVGENNGEVILSSGSLAGYKDYAAVQLWGPRRAGGDGWSIVIPLRELVDSYETINGLPVDEDPEFDPLNPYENRDPRLKATIFTNGDVDSYFDPEFTFYVEPGMTTADATSAAASYSGFVYKKYIDAEGLKDQPNCGIDVILFRLAEMYLIYAEANIENSSGNVNEAINALNKVRARVYGADVSETSNYPAVTTTDKTELRRILRRERKVELAGEGFRLIDIRRWKIAENVMPGKLYGRATTPAGWAKNFQVPVIDNVTGRVRYTDESGFEKAMGSGSRKFDPSKDYFWLIPLSETDANIGID